MKVRFLKSFNDKIKQEHFTIGKEYEVESIDSKGKYWVKDDSGITSSLFNIEVEVIRDEHYNNENGSLYLFAQHHNLNAWEFDILKRVVRCRKKGQFKEDLEKTKRVIDLYLKEFEA